MTHVVSRMPKHEQSNDGDILPRLVLCGYERGGTTLLSELFRNNGYESGFECGALMCDSPREFRNFRPYIDMLSDGWNIEPCKIPEICDGSFEEFYIKLITEAFSNKHEPLKFFDKTPIYMRKIGSVLNKTSFIEKACIIHRDPRAIFVSWAKRVGKGKSIEEVILNNLDNFCARYLDYFIGSAAHIENSNVMFIPFEQLCLRPDSYHQSIGLFANGIPFSPIKSGSRFGNVSGIGIDIYKIFEYEAVLSRKLQNQILERTRLASIFFANPEETKKYIDQWLEKKANISKILNQLDINSVSVLANGVYFEPVTYLLLYPDVLNAKMNPINHYINYGRKEGRRPC